MSYVNAPATALVAMSCCVCGRELLEAESIASGIGPVCAEKTGFGRPGLPVDVRGEVNRLVYELAALQRSVEAIPKVARLRALGFDELATRIAARLEELLEIRIELAGDAEELLVVSIPRVDDRAVFDQLLEGLRRVPGRRWTEMPGRAGKVTVVPNNAFAIRALYEALSRVFAGRAARSPKGPFIMPTLPELRAAYARRPHPQGAPIMRERIPAGVPALPPDDLPADALFQVEDGEPIPWANLEDANPLLSDQHRVAIRKLALGKTVKLVHPTTGQSVRIRRTR